jgi:hypothetical protein
VAAHSRRAALVAATCGAMLVVAGAAAPARASAHATCPPVHAHVIARDHVLRVYSAAGSGPFATATYACLVSSGARLTLLATPHGFGVSLGRTALAGYVVAYLVTRFGVDSGSTSLEVADVAARHKLRSLPVGRYVDAGLLGAETVTSLVVDAHGAVAWISSSHGPGISGTVLAVHAASRTGAPRTLDEGSAIDPARLSLSGGVLSWFDGGVGRTAAMP